MPQQRHLCPRLLANKRTKCYNKRKKRGHGFPLRSFVRHRRPEKHGLTKALGGPLFAKNFISFRAIRRLAERAEKELLCLSCNTNAKNAEKNLKSLCRNLTIPSSAPTARRPPCATGAEKCFPLRGKNRQSAAETAKLAAAATENRSKKRGTYPAFFFYTIAEPSIKDAITPLAPAFLKAAASVAGVAIFPRSAYNTSSARKRKRVPPPRRAGRRRGASPCRTR